jgi:hypothetical protein
MQWLQKMLKTSTHVVVAHDAHAIDVLIEKGVIKDGVYLGRSD